MHPIKVKPNFISIVGIVILLVMTSLFFFCPDFFGINKENQNHDLSNGVSIAFLLLALFFLSQLKNITISDGKIIVLYILTRKKITATMEMISRVTFGNTQMNAGSPMLQNTGDNIICLYFKDQRKTKVRVHGGFHSNMESMAQYINTNYPGLCW
jgi:hypothetical protein